MYIVFRGHMSQSAELSLTLTSKPKTSGKSLYLSHFQDVLASCTL